MPARLLACILLLLLGLAAWAWWRPAGGPLPWPAGGAGAVSRAVPGLAGPGPAVRKCHGAAGVTYTQDACPPGTREAALSGGTLTVLPAAPAAARAASAGAAASAVSPLRRLAGAHDPREFQERRIEHAVQGGAP